MSPLTGTGLSFAGLSGGYGDTVVVRELTGKVTAGRTLGVLGRNGVGKTTLMRLLMGYNRPYAGQVLFDGKDLSAMPPFARNRLGMGYAPQESVVFDKLTVLENLTLHRKSRSLDAYAPYFDAFPRIAQRLRQEAGSMSGGEKKLLSFTRTLVGNSHVILLDEPTEGVQQENITLMVALVRQRLEHGVGFVVVEQNLSFLLEVMDTVMVLDHGHCVLEGSADQYSREVLQQHLMV